MELSSEKGGRQADAGVRESTGTSGQPTPLHTVSYCLLNNFVLVIRLIETMLAISNSRQPTEPNIFLLLLLFACIGNRCRASFSTSVELYMVMSAFL